MNKVTIATAPCSWGVWYFDGTPSKTPAEIFLNQAAEAGYKALELGPDGYLPTEPSALKNALSSRGMSVAAGTACWAFDQFENFFKFQSQLDNLCQRISSLDGKYLVVMDESDVGLYSEKKKYFPLAEWQKYLSMFRDIGKYTQSEYGIATVFHPHIKSLIETEKEITLLMEYTDLDLCFDTGHHAYVNGTGLPGDTSVRDFLKKYANRIPYLHFKQVDGAIYKKVMTEHLDSDTAFNIGVMCDLPDGIIDFMDIKTTLDEICFEGIAVVESDMPTATTEKAFASAKRNLTYLRDIGLVD